MRMMKRIPSFFLNPAIFLCNFDASPFANISHRFDAFTMQIGRMFEIALIFTFVDAINLPSKESEQQRILRVL